jgi:hypothetical protein
MMFTGMTLLFVPLLAPANPMSYDTLQFYSGTLAIVAGCSTAALSFRLLPPLSSAFRTLRLLVLTLWDLRRPAMGRAPVDWEGHIYARLSAMPDAAMPLQRAMLMAALSVGSEIIQLRHIAHRLALGADLDPALAALAGGNSALAIITSRPPRCGTRWSWGRRSVGANRPAGAWRHPRACDVAQFEIPNAVATSLITPESPSPSDERHFGGTASFLAYYIVHEGPHDAPAGRAARQR